VDASDAALKGGVALVLSRGVNVTVRWETLALEVRDAQGAVVGAPDLFEGTTRVMMMSFICACRNKDDDVFYLFLQKQKIGDQLHIYL